MDRKYRLLLEFVRYGVLHREAVKNDALLVRRLLRDGLVRKTCRQGRVFYELTDKALPMLELQRKRLLEEVRLRALLEPHSALYASLVSDLRFLDERQPTANDFLFLGDWQLLRPVVPSQLELAKYRFYHEVVSRRTRQKRAA